MFDAQIYFRWKYRLEYQGGDEADLLIFFRKRLAQYRDFPGILTAVQGMKGIEWECTEDGGLVIRRTRGLPRTVWVYEAPKLTIHERKAGAAATTPAKPTPQCGQHLKADNHE